VQTVNTILIHAPRERIVETVADLALWPAILPHFRYIRFHEQSPTRNIVKMAASRGGIPVSWVTEQRIDREGGRISFRHQRSWTKGLEVHWSFVETSAGVQVEVVHSWRFRWPVFAWIFEPLIGRFFIRDLADKTLFRMKAYLENGR